MPSNQHKNILELGYLTLNASRVLLPDDTVAEAEITNIGEDISQALLIKRFENMEEDIQLSSVLAILKVLGMLEISA